MSADAKIMEALARIEHKVDLLLEYIQVPNTSFSKLASVKTCPVCTQPISFDIDINDAVVVRKCGCSTGKIALDMGAFAPPVTPARKKDEDGGTDQEDRRDTDRRGGSGWKR